MRFAKLGVIPTALVLTFGAFASQPQTLPERVVFAVWPAQKGERPDAPILDPVVILDGKDFRNPMAYLQEKDTTKAQADAYLFEKKYLVAGRKYTMLFGGNDKGSIVVREASGIGCESLAATLIPPIPSANGQKALAATSTIGIGLHPNWREPPSPQQEAAFVKLTAEVLADQGVNAVAPAAVKLRNLRATKLGSDRPAALIGSVTFKAKDANHNLFLVAEQNGNRWSIVLSSYHASKDLADGVDDIEENFLDQLDLDGDGMDEIITISGYYESWDYTIYRLEQGAWKKVYQGGGGGC